MDTDVETVFALYRHIFADFTQNHASIYKLLWRIEPISPENIIAQANISRATTFKILKDLVVFGLVKKTSFKPVGYYAPSPVEIFCAKMKVTVSKLENGKEKLAALMNNSSGLSGEIFLIKRDGGQQTLINKTTRKKISDEKCLFEIRNAVDCQLGQMKTRKQWAMYR